MCPSVFVFKNKACQATASTRFRFGKNGLTVPSVALVFQLTAIDKTNCLQLLGVLDPATLDQIFAELDNLTGR